ncbi:polysaccharide deacetylase family protein [Peribacillus muralis]|uniref:polysaccharide deacetylase family protein n=1 Tax=Peribacillus muralis TaxID=264697 RepID=UPI001F4DE325|nr:polysaccharide deacetylase family protein [Peribacillus muralis]MCK1992947.1 polysaccharide deacetylase family protein [Peribacillus muralis]MCK2013502.1 polysaccharide deacetylase family protein [Peribacillus muralis]
MGNAMIAGVQENLIRGQYIRAINYHNTHVFDSDRFERELKFYQQNFSPVTQEDLDEFFVTKQWKKEKPGLILSMFEAYRNNYDVALPLLEKYGFVGWYHVITDFIDTPVKLQKEFAETHNIDNDRWDEYSIDQRYAMTWDEVRQVAKNHVICSHTRSHYRITLDTPEEVMKREIVESKHILEDKLQQDVDVFCWLGGGQFNSNPLAAEYIEKAGYHYLFGNSKIHRIAY